jgi:hypothetical protein
MEDDLWTWSSWDGPGADEIVSFLLFEEAARRLGLGAVPRRFYLGERVRRFNLGERARTILDGWAEPCAK